MSNIYNSVVELVACAERTSTLTPSSGVDVSDYTGAMNIILQSSAATAGTNPTLNCKLQESDESGANFTDVSGATFAEVTDAADVTEMIIVNVDELKQYIRVVCTVGGTSTPTFQFGVSAVASKQVKGAPTLVA